jgi:hypothetical protein
MLGGILLALVLVIVLPVAMIMVGPLVAAALGSTLKDDAEQRNEGSEHIALNR